MTADHILDLLAAKHHKEVFVSECKNGPSQFTGHLRLDAWVMFKSWTNPRTIGYEVKVSRSDFLADNKWRAYLPYCNEFYFVGPPGIIDVSELSAEAGLLVTSKTGARLFTKRKAPYRALAIPEDLYQYILMCRTRITREWWNDGKGQTEYWRAWLAENRESQEIGRDVSRRIQEVVAERIDKVEGANRDLRMENGALAIVKRLCDELGIDLTRQWSLRDELERAMAKLNGGELCQQLARTEEALAQARKAIEATR